MSKQFCQIWEDEEGQEWEVLYHMEGTLSRGTLEEPPEFPWCEIDSITNIQTGEIYSGKTEAIEGFLDANHEDEDDCLEFDEDY